MNDMTRFVALNLRQKTQDEIERNHAVKRTIPTHKLTNYITVKPKKPWHVYGADPINEAKRISITVGDDTRLSPCRRYVIAKDEFGSKNKRDM